MSSWQLREWKMDDNGSDLLGKEKGYYCLGLLLLYTWIQFVCLVENLVISNQIHSLSWRSGGRSLKISCPLDLYSLVLIFM